MLFCDFEADERSPCVSDNVFFCFLSLSLFGYAIIPITEILSPRYCRRVSDNREKIERVSRRRSSGPFHHRTSISSTVHGRESYDLSARKLESRKNETSCNFYYFFFFRR